MKKTVLVPIKMKTSKTTTNLCVWNSEEYRDSSCVSMRLHIYTRCTLTYVLFLSLCVFISLLVNSIHDDISILHVPFFFAFLTQIREWICMLVCILFLVSVSSLGCLFFFLLSHPLNRIVCTWSAYSTMLSIMLTSLLTYYFVVEKNIDNDNEHINVYDERLVDVQG